MGLDLECWDDLYNRDLYWKNLTLDFILISMKKYEGR